MEVVIACDYLLPCFYFVVFTVRVVLAFILKVIPGGEFGLPDKFSTWKYK